MTKLLDAFLHPQRPYSWIMAVTLAVLFGYLIRQFPDVNQIDTRNLDIILAHKGEVHERHDKIVVVGIGDEDLAAYTPYRMPIHRGLLADLVDHLSAAGARAIGFDIMFVDPTAPELDERLQASIRNAESAVIIATGSAENGFSQSQLLYQTAFNSGLTTGTASLVVGQDGTIRRQSPHKNGGLTFPAAIANAVGADVPDEEFFIDYRRGTELGGFSFQTIPALKALNAHPAFFKDKIVLIGATMPDDRDDHPTPLDQDNQEVLGC